jgi:uncharacterized membrane protein (UPF0127 family)
MQPLFIGIRETILKMVPFVFSVFSFIAYAGDKKPCKEDTRREKRKCPVEVTIAPFNICDSPKGLTSALDKDFECLKIPNSKEIGYFGPGNNVNKNYIYKYLTESAKKTVYGSSKSLDWAFNEKKTMPLKAGAGLNINQYGKFLPDLSIKASKDSSVTILVSVTNAHFVRIPNIEKALKDQIYDSKPDDASYRDAQYVIAEMCRNDTFVSVDSLVGTIEVTISSDNKNLLDGVAGVKNLAGVTFSVSKNKDGSSTLKSTEAVLAVKYVESSDVVTQVCEPCKEAQSLINSSDFIVKESDSDVDTRMNITYGDRVVLSASGQIWAGVLATGKNGPKGWNDISDDKKFPFPGSYPYGLIGKIDGSYFYVGDGKDWTYQGKGGTLLLRTNDDAPGGGDGSFNVKVEVWRDKCVK